MYPINSCLIHKIIPPKSLEGNSKAPALILLHGRGANEDDLLDLSDYLDDRLFFISPRAPFNFEYGGYKWFDIENDWKPNLRMLTESYNLLKQFYEDIKTGYSLDTSKIFLLGFSMGTMMSYIISIANPKLFAGVIANSGYIPEGIDLNDKIKKLDNLPFFIAHGIYDPIIPVELGRKTKEILEKANAKVVYKEYPMAHQISQESLNDISTWLTVQINKSDNEVLKTTQ